jgi:predicted phosphodiesterase
MVQSIHASDAEWLAEEIERSNEHQLVVVTHHIPSASLVHPKYRMFDSSDFACECDHLFKSPVRAWIYGHTHTPSVHVRGGVYCVTNPIGYPGENVRFDAGTTIEL